MSGNNEADLVGGCDADEKDEWDQVLEEDRAEVEPDGDEDPGTEEGGEPEEGGDDGEALSATGTDDREAAKSPINQHSS